MARTVSHLKKGVLTKKLESDMGAKRAHDQHQDQDEDHDAGEAVAQIEVAA